METPTQHSTSKPRSSKSTSRAVTGVESVTIRSANLACRLKIRPGPTSESPHSERLGPISSQVDEAPCFDVSEDVELRHDGLPRLVLTHYTDCSPRHHAPSEV